MDSPVSYGASKEAEWVTVTEQLQSVSSAARVTGAEDRMLVVVQSTGLELELAELRVKVKEHEDLLAKIGPMLLATKIRAWGMAIVPYVVSAAIAVLGIMIPKWIDMTAQLAVIQYKVDELQRLSSQLERLLARYDLPAEEEMPTMAPEELEVSAAAPK